MRFRLILQSLFACFPLVSRLLAGILVWTIACAPLMAQTPEEAPKAKNYVPCYLIIFFAVGLGLMMICRAGKRSIEFRRD